MSRTGGADGPRSEALLLVDLQVDYLLDEAMARRRPALCGAVDDLAGTPGAAALPELDRRGVTTVRKTRDSAFHRTDLAELLVRRGVQRLVVVGVSTDSCVDATAADAYAHDLRVVLVDDATASPDPGRHRAALEDLRSRFRQPVVAAADVARRWRAGRSCADLLTGPPGS